MIRYKRRASLKLIESKFQRNTLEETLRDAVRCSFWVIS
jgi:hypothetical protein